MRHLGLFDYLAADDSDRQAVARKAAALATKRSKIRYEKFLKAASNAVEARQRFDVIEDDFNLTIEAACAEAGYDDYEGIKRAVYATLMQREAIRRPRMCPYHKEVTDIALAAGDPSAGFNAMAQHAWGAQHCQGSEYEGAKCNFKPEMTTQTFWDTKAEQAEQRRQERQEQVLEPSEPELEPTDEQLEPVDVVDEPSAVGEGAEPDFVDEPQQLEPMAAKTAEALEKQDVTQGGEGPSPKMDKRKWTVDNVTPLDTEGEGSPHPTKRVDILEPIVDDRNDDFLEGTKAVTEKQDVTKEWNHPRGEGGSWSGTNGLTSPVSKTAGQDSVMIHGGTLAPLARIENRFPGVTIGGQPLFAERPMQGWNPGAHPLIDQNVPGQLEHPDPTINGVVQKIGLEDGMRPPGEYLRELKQALEAEGRWGQPGQAQASVQKHSPGKKHLPYATPKRNRQYEHIKERCMKDGGSEDECAELAARTVNKQRAEKGETKKGAEDVDKNPLRELIETGFEGFVPQGQVENAIKEHDNG